MKKLLIACLVAAVVAAAAFFVLQKQRKDAVFAFIASVPGELKAESVEACPFSDNVTVRNITGTVRYFNEAPFEVNIGLLRLEGLNSKAAQGQGQVKIADVLLFEQTSFTAPEGSQALMGYSELQVERTEIKGIWADPDAFIKASGTSPVSGEYMNALLSLRFGPSVSTNMEAKGIALNVPQELDIYGLANSNFSLKAAHSEADSYTITNMGKMLVRNMDIEFEGGKAQMAELTIQGMKMPEELYRGMTAGSPALQDPEAILALYASGVSVDGLKADKLHLELDGLPPLDIAELGASMFMGENEINLAMQSRDAVVPFSFFAPLMEVPDYVVEQVGDRTFHFSTRHELRSAAEDGKLHIGFDAQFNEPELADINQSLSFTGKASDGPIRAVPANGGLFLEKVDFDIKDSGLIGFVYQLAGITLAPQMGGVMSAEELGKFLRTQQVQELRALPMPEGSPLAQLQDNAATFLEQGGALKVNCTPEKPLSIMQLFLALQLGPQALANIPFESSYTAP